MCSTRKDNEEYVMVFPTSLLRTLGNFQGISFDTRHFLEILLDPSNCKFLKRKDAEANQSFKQIIPYAILRHKGSVFSYKREKLLTERRLEGNYSIGVGGHVSVQDPNLFTTVYQEALRREIDEEININSRYEEKAVAILNDDSNDVGKVHFGIIHLLTLEQPLVKSKEKSIVETKFQSIAELRKNLSRFENWSKICIKHIEKILSN